MVEPEVEDLKCKLSRIRDKDMALGSEEACSVKPQSSEATATPRPNTMRLVPALSGGLRCWVDREALSLSVKLFPYTCPANTASKFQNVILIKQISGAALQCETLEASALLNVESDS